MAASKKTAEQILDIFLRHVPDKQTVLNILRDMKKEVKGNQSVKDTIDKLYRIATK